MEQKEIESLIQAFLNSIKNYFFFERNLYPNKTLKKVKKLIPPSIGMHGGGQKGGNPPLLWSPPPPGPGWAGKMRIINTKLIIKNNFLFIM